MIDLREVKIYVFKVNEANMHQLNDARALLYDVYVFEERWLPDSNNPSAIKVSEAPDGRKILVDKYDWQAEWVVAYYNNELIACARARERDINHKFEVQTYPYSAALNSYLDINRHPKLLELNRATVDKRYRQSGVLICLLDEGLKVAIERQISLFTIVVNEKLVNLFRSIGFEELNIRIKYEEKDTTLAIPFFARYENNKLNEIHESLKVIRERLICQFIRLNDDKKKPLVQFFEMVKATQHTAQTAAVNRSDKSVNSLNSKL
jgi:ribosomal protein S18 acetylase RimI-like enzyme